MCAAIEETPTSGRRALTQLIRAARLNGSGSVAAPSATSSQIVGRPVMLIVRSLGGSTADPTLSPPTAAGTGSDPGARDRAYGRSAARKPRHAAGHDQVL